MGTRGKLLVAALIVGVAGYVVFRRPSPPTQRAATHAVPGETGHALEIDHAMAAVIALQRAPEGKTPCESAYNAYSASKDVSDTQGVKAVVLTLAPREEFLARCAELPAGAQACLVPRYLAAHHQECVMARASADTLRSIVQLLQRTEPIDDSEPLPSRLGTAPGSAPPQ